MDLRQLKSFLHVAELGSLSRAADRLYIAQPALSRQIRMLEEELNTPLFTRHGRGMALTESGRLLMERATSILRQVEEVRDDLRSSAVDIRGRVVVGIPPSVGDVLAARIAKRFLDAFPEVEMRIVAAFTSHLIDWLQRGDIDVAVLYDPEQPLHLRTTPLMLENLFLIAPGARGLSLHKAIRFSALAEEELLLPSPQHSLRRLIEDVAARQHVRLRIRIEADALNILKDLALAGLGATILPLPAVNLEMQQGLVCAAPIVEPTLARRLILALPADRPSSRAVLRFADELRAEINDMVEGGTWVGYLLGR